MNNEKHLSDLVRIYDDMLLSTFWVLTVRKRINMYASIHITDLRPWTSEFLYFSLQMFYFTSTCKIASSIIFPLIMSFIYHVTELPQICMKQNVLKVTRIKLILHIFSTVLPLLPGLLRFREPVASQGVWAEDPIGNGEHSFL